MLSQIKISFITYFFGASSKLIIFFRYKISFLRASFSFINISNFCFKSVLYKSSSSYVGQLTKVYENIVPVYGSEGTLSFPLEAGIYQIGIKSETRRKMNIKFIDLNIKEGYSNYPIGLEKTNN